MPRRIHPSTVQWFWSSRYWVLPILLILECSKICTPFILFYSNTFYLREKRWLIITWPPYNVVQERLWNSFMQYIIDAHWNIDFSPNSHLYREQYTLDVWFMTHYPIRIALQGTRCIVQARAFAKRKKTKATKRKLHATFPFPWLPNGQNE